MTSIFIPTKNTLALYSANPAALSNDREAEEFFVNEDNCGFLKAWASAIQQGLSTVSYTTTTALALEIERILTTPKYKFGFVAGDFSQTSGGPNLIRLTLTWTYA